MIVWLPIIPFFTLRCLRLQILVIILMRKQERMRFLMEKYASSTSVMMLKPKKNSRMLPVDTGTRKNTIFNFTITLIALHIISPIASIKSKMILRL